MAQPLSSSPDGLPLYNHCLPGSGLTCVERRRLKRVGECEAVVVGELGSWYTTTTGLFQCDVCKGFVTWLEWSEQKQLQWDRLDRVWDWNEFWAALQEDYRKELA